ncbi:MAG: dienelactone hydrolase family protein [Polaromonas sp.]|uniref:dienelactone hydrolase family protein n=1 Tax=Polaromonas sp. TaxID=1869339 RepID=UPI0025E60D84|nr:dienelactone hydrolase family protein [Polaromonas sp.]MBI2728956.1 dienelactone hydrolase family protein [Polaromonas sp.]
MTSRTDSIRAGSAASGQHFDAYVSVPENPNGHAVIVLQEIFGVTPPVRKVSDRFAEAGYLAVAPDLFWRVEPGLSLSHSKEDMARAFSILGNFSDDSAMQDIQATLAHIKALPGFRGRVAVTGMCLGGKLTYLAAARMKLDAAIAFYGVGIEKHLDEAKGITSPTLMFFGGIDKYVTEGARRDIASAVRGKAEVVVYPQADHGFYTRGEADTVADAHQKALAFLSASLNAQRI